MKNSRNLCDLVLLPAWQTAPWNGKFRSGLMVAPTPIIELHSILSCHLLPSPTSINQPHFENCVVRQDIGCPLGGLVLARVCGVIP